MMNYALPLKTFHFTITKGEMLRFYEDTVLTYFELC